MEIHNPRRIFIITPSFGIHGGIRVILEWANQLVARGHTVFLHCLSGPKKCTWFPIARQVQVVLDDTVSKTCDLLIITSPHSIHYEERELPKKKFIFLQNMEHLFRKETDTGWYAMCKRTYTSELPLICIARWNLSDLKIYFDRKAITYYVGNGVNLVHFPIDRTPKDDKTVLVEGWIPSNPTKDTDRLGPKVAARLKQEGYRILAYSAQVRDRPYADIPDQYYTAPNLETLNLLYKQATILIKATHVDARACAPMEAMTKGTVTARAIHKGDDDLTHCLNSLRCEYNEEELYTISKRLLVDGSLRQYLAGQCYNHVITYSWEYWMDKIERILWTGLS